MVASDLARPDPGAPRVLHVRVVTGQGGGPEKTILRSRRYADGSRYDIEAAYIHPRGDKGFATIAEHARSQACPLWAVPERGAFDLRTARNLLNLCRQRDVRIWHAHDYKSNVLGLLLRRWHPMKLITTVHGWTWDTCRAHLHHHLDNWCLPRYEHVLAVSPPLTDHCRRHGVSPERLTYVPNAIDSDEHQRRQTADDAKRALGIDRTRLVIGVIGRLSVEKGVERAIRALPRVLATVGHVELHIVGDGPQRSALQSAATALGIAAQVRFHGWQSQTRGYLEAMDVLLLPSLTEGLPNVVLEAMAMEVPVAATEVGGVGDLLDRGNCGVLLGQEWSRWPASLTPMLPRAPLRRDLALKALDRVRRQFSFRKRMQRVMEVYDRVLGAQPQSAAA